MNFNQSSEQVHAFTLEKIKLTPTSFNLSDNCKNEPQVLFEKFLDHWHRLRHAILEISNMTNYEIHQHFAENVYHNPLEIDGVATYRELLFKGKPILQMQKTGTRFFITHDKQFVGGKTLDDLAEEF